MHFGGPPFPIYVMPISRLPGPNPWHGLSLDLAEGHRQFPKDQLLPGASSWLFCRGSESFFSACAIWGFPWGYLQSSSILVGCSIRNHPFWGTPISGNPILRPLFLMILGFWSKVCTPTRPAPRFPRSILLCENVGLQGCVVSFPFFAPHRLSPPYSRLQEYARIRCWTLERSSLHVYFTLINPYYVNHVKQEMHTQTSELKACKQLWVQKLLLSKYVWHGMAWHGMTWHGMAWYSTVWYGMVRYGMVWYGMVGMYLCIYVCM